MTNFLTDKMSVDDLMRGPRIESPLCSLFHWRVFSTQKRPDKLFHSFHQSILQGIPKKDARFSKVKNIPDLLSDNKEGKIM